LRRTCSAPGVRGVLALLTLAAVALPGALLAGQVPAAASTVSTAKPASTGRPGQATDSQVSVSITSMSPQWATPKATITVQGVVTNQSKDPITDLSVVLEASNQAFSSSQTLQTYLGSPYETSASQSVGQQAIHGTLQPGRSATWSISFRARKAGLTSFGVYPLTAIVSASVQGAPAPSLSYDFTLLPYVPAKRGTYAHSVPAPRQIAWVWPLIDSPLVSQPGRRACSGPQVSALRASLEAGGRLNTLLMEGIAYAQHDQITWVVDPALLSDVRSLSKCAHAPGAAKAATQWLATLKKETATDPMFATPYADVDLGLISQGDSADVAQAFETGGRIATGILGRDLKVPAAQSGTPAITAMDWPTNGTAVYTAVETLAGSDHIQSMLLDSSATSTSGTSFLTDTGQGTLDHVLLYSDALNRLLGTGRKGPGSEFAASQDFLAETALMAQQDPASPIVVAPPQRWQPTSGLSTDVLSDTARAPWLSPVPLASLEGHTSGTLPLANTAGRHAFSRTVIRRLAAITGQINELTAIISSGEAQSLYQSRAALESSARHGTSRTRTRQLLGLSSPLLEYLSSQERGISLVLSQRVTLGGLKGDVPVGIDSSLNYPVEVKLQWTFAAPPDGGNLHVTQKPAGTITVPAHGEVPVKIHVAAGQVGSTTITVWLVSPQGQRLTGSQSRVVTVQATEFGNLAMIILAAALGLFVIGSGIRAARRGRASPPDSTGESGQLNEDAERTSQEAAGTDTVVPEHSELGTAGTSGL
jgi:hypothetical protein